MRSRRLVYSLLVIVTIAAGLAVHLHGAAPDRAVRDVLGDALWASLIFWLRATLRPGARRVRLAMAALAFCFAIELSQMIRADWLRALRRTTAGHLVLGSDFDPRDLLAYSAGVAAAALIDAGLRRIIRERKSVIAPT